MSDRPPFPLADFWASEWTWPADAYEPRRIFLGRAVDVIGKAMFGDDGWTGHEFGALEIEPPRQISRAPPPIRPLRGSAPREVRLSEVEGPPALTGEQLQELLRRLEASRAAADAEREEINNRVRALKQAAFRVEQEISAACHSGALDSWTQDPHTADLAKIPSQLWGGAPYTWQGRFTACSIDLSNPMRNRSAEDLDWRFKPKPDWRQIFVGAAALDALAHRLRLAHVARRPSWAPRPDELTKNWPHRPEVQDELRRRCPNPKTNGEIYDALMLMAGEYPEVSVSSREAAKKALSGTAIIAEQVRRREERREFRGNGSGG